MNKTINEKLGLNADVQIYAEDIANNIFDIIVEFMTEKGGDDFRAEYHAGAGIRDKAKTFKVRGIELLIEIRGFKDIEKAPGKNKFFTEGFFNPDSIVVYNDGTLSFELGIQPRVHISYNDIDLLKKDKGLILKQLESTLSHELTHAYEEYFRRINKEKDNRLDSTLDASIDNLGKHLMQFFQQRTDESRNDFFNFSYLLYAIASYEINARVAESYVFIKEFDSNDKKLSELKKTYSWEVCQNLINWKAEEFLKKITKDHTEQEIKDFVLSLKETCLQINSEMANKIFSTFKEDKNKFSETQTNYIKNNIKAHGEAIKHLSKDPIKFFEHFQKKFNEGGEKMRRKLLRLISL